MLTNEIIISRNKKKKFYFWTVMLDNHGSHLLRLKRKLGEFCFSFQIIYNVCVIIRLISFQSKCDSRRIKILNLPFHGFTLDGWTQGKTCLRRSSTVTNSLQWPPLPFLCRGKENLKKTNVLLFLYRNIF